MGSGGDYDVFVSYARSDAAAAAELNGWLNEQGLGAFFDRSALRPGLRWVPALEDAIGRSKAVAILIGPHGIGNTQQYERELALIRQTADNTFPVIPVLMPGCDSPPTGFLQLLTWVDLSKGKSVRDQAENLEALRGIASLFANPKTRLLVTDYETVQGSARAGSEARSTVEVAHEALIQRWPTLRDWVRANRENLRARAAILRTKAEWEEKGESDEFLLDPGVQLERGRALLANPGDVAVDDIRDYVGHSIAKDERRLVAKREAELADQKRIADARKRTSQVALAGLVIALLVAAAAVWQYLRATEATRLAEVATLEAERSAKDARANLSQAQMAQSRFLADLAARKRAEGDAGTTVLLALEALPDDAADAPRPYVPEAELQLDSGWRDLRERLDLGHDGAVWSAAFSPDGTRIVTASADKTARVWEVFPDTQALVSAAKAAVPRCLTLAQRKAFYLSPDPPAWCVEKAKWPFSTAEWEQWLRDLQDGENPPLPAAP